MFARPYPFVAYFAFGFVSAILFSSSCVHKRSSFLPHRAFSRLDKPVRARIITLNYFVPNAAVDEARTDKYANRCTFVWCGLLDLQLPNSQNICRNWIVLFTVAARPMCRNNGCEWFSVVVRMLNECVLLVVLRIQLSMKRWHWSIVQLKVIK